MILCSGTIGSPQLLLLSGIGERRHLEGLGIPLVHHLPGVGYNLQDHVAAYGLTWTTKGTGNAYNPFLYTADPRTYINWKLFRSGTITLDLLIMIQSHLTKTLANQGGRLH